MSKPKLFKPSLACDADTDKLVFPLWVQYKVDGVRMLVRDSIATGRSMKKCKNVKMTEYFSQPCFEGFDMEVGATYPNDSDLCRLTTSLVSTIKGDLPKFVVVFDYITKDSLETGVGYNDRMRLLQNHLKYPPADGEVKLIVSKQYLMNSLEELEAFYTEALTLGYEGVIIRKQDGVHKSGRCTMKEGNYLRMKPTGDSEGVVLSLEEAYENTNEAKVNELGHTERSTHKANMKPKGMIGALWLRDVHSGLTVKVGAGKLTHEERTLYFQQPELILGELVKYAFLDTGQKDAPRHPRYISHRCIEDMSK